LRAPRRSTPWLALPLALAAGLGARAVAAQTPPPVGLALDGMSYVLSRGDAVELRIEAQRADVSPAGGMVQLHGVRARIEAASGQPAAAGMELVCQRGELDLRTREFVALGNVAASAPGGRFLRTERLVFRQEEGVVSSDAPVALTDASGDYRGGGFVYWVREDRFRLTGGARIVQGE
jgi:hypothetical protein